MAKEESKIKVEAKVNTELFNKFIDTLSNRELLHDMYLRTFNSNKVPLNGSDDMLRDCIQELKDYYKIE